MVRVAALWGVEVDGEALGGQHGVREHLLRLLEQWGLVDVSLGVVAQDETLHSGFLRHCGCFARGAVIALPRLGGGFVAIGGLMIEPVDALHGLDDAAREFSVAAIGVTAAGLGWGGEQVAGNHGAIGGCPVFAVAQTVARIVRHTILCQRFAIDVAQFGFLVEAETHRGHAVEQRERAHRDGIVLIDDLAPHLDDVETQVERALAAKVVHPLPE